MATHKADDDEIPLPIGIDEDIKILNDRIEEIKSNLVKEREDLEKIRDNKKVQIVALKKTVKNSKGIIKNLNKKKEIKIRIISSNKSKEIHMPTNSSITTKLGSSFSNSTFNEIKLINKIGINIKNLTR